MMPSSKDAIGGPDDLELGSTIDLEDRVMVHGWIMRADVRERYLSTCSEPGTGWSDVRLVQPDETVARS